MFNNEKICISLADLISHGGQTPYEIMITKINIETQSQLKSNISP